jgi:hypothetical protein
VGSEQLVPCTEKGTYRSFLKNRFREKNIPICLQDVIYVLNLTFNLLSITKCISKHGVQFTAKNSRLFLNIKGTQVKFEKELMHGSGKLYAADIIPSNGEAAYLIMDFDKLHIVMGHPHNVTLKDTAKANNIQLTGVHHNPCSHCAKAKTRMKRIPKEAHDHATLKAERLMIDLSWIKVEKIAKNQYWLLVMDEYTNFLCSFFLEHKDDQIQIVIKLIKSLQNETNVKVKYICFEDSGEDHQDEWENMRGEAAILLAKIIIMNLRLLQQCMMGTQNLNHIRRL